MLESGQDIPARPGPSVPPGAAGFRGTSTGRSGGPTALRWDRAGDGGGAGAQTPACGGREMVLRDRRGLRGAAPAPPAPAPLRVGSGWALGAPDTVLPSAEPPPAAPPHTHPSVRERPRSVTLHPLLAKPCD